MVAINFNQVQILYQFHIVFKGGDTISRYVNICIYNVSETL
jgi:hypothetical protein